MSAEAFRERLRRLRREDRAALPAASSELPPSLQRRLARGRPSELPVSPVLGELRTAEGPGGPFAAREVVRPADARHGSFQLSEIDAAVPQTLALLARDPALTVADLRRAVYLDTETSGLSGGAGTWVFLVGLGAFAGDDFRVWQGFLREPGEEPALLAEVARRIAAAPLVVSFFGKSFDRHRLEDKMRLHGITPPFAGRPHLDLFHPMRRLVRGWLPDTRLSTVESTLAGHVRADDLPGAFAPAAWFDYLAGRTHLLDGVFRHNLEDVLSLVTLAAYLGRVEAETRADGTPLSGCPCARARALACAHDAGGDLVQAQRWVLAALAREGGGRRRDLELAHAELLRRRGEHGAAGAALAAFLAAPADRFTAPAALAHAKLLEHRERDLAAAREVCRAALAELPRFHVGAERTRYERDLTARIARLGRRLGMGGGERSGESLRS